MPKKNTIWIVGLGPGGPEQLTPEALSRLQSGFPLYMRTSRHPVVTHLKDQGLRFQTFDRLYDDAGTFEEVYEAIADQLLSQAQKSSLVYAVPGHPLVAETAVTLIRDRAIAAGVSVEIIPGLSCLEAIYARLQLEPHRGLLLLDSLDMEPEQLNRQLSTLVLQVYSRDVASEVKLTLMDVYDDDHPVTVVRAAGFPDDERIEEMPLYLLDRIDWIDHLTSLYVPPIEIDDQDELAHLKPLDAFRAIIAQLRDPDGGCPWDLKQTPQTLKKYIMEEAFEAIEAIESEDPDKICEELGDLLLQIGLQAQIAEEEGLFNLDDVAQEINEKLIRRHPHVFGDRHQSTADGVVAQWEEIKTQEKKGKGDETLLGSIPTGMPSLFRAYKLGLKAATVGFEWPDQSGVLDKIAEEINELRGATEPEDIQHELGDLLFTIVNLARWYKVDPEEALRHANHRFTERFTYIEQNKPKEWSEMTLDEMEALWQEAKNLS